VRLKPQRLLRSFSWTFLLIAVAILWSADPAAAQRPPISKFPHTAVGLAVAGGDWDFFIAGDHLNFRRGSAKMTESFQSLTLPSAGKKLAADSQNVYVWLDDQHVVSYAITDLGPTGTGVARSGDDRAATEAFRRPYVSSTRMHVQAVTSPEGQTIAPQRLYVANSSSDSVTAIDTSSNQILATINLNMGANPQDVQIAPNNVIAFTANAGGGATCSTCANLGAQSFDPVALTSAGNTVGAASPEALAYTPDSTQVFVADAPPATVRGYSTSTGASTGSAVVAAAPYALTVSADGTNLYALQSDDLYYSAGYNIIPNNEISVISTAGLGAVTNYLIPAGSSGNTGLGIGCFSMALSPVSGYLYVSCTWDLYGTSATPAIYVISLSGGTITIQNTFFTPGPCYGLAFSPDGSKLYVAQYAAAGSVIVMDPNLGTQLATIGVGGGPTAIVVNSSGTFGYVPNYTSNTVSVLNLSSNTLSATITVGTNPTAVALSYAAPGSSIGNIAATVNGASFAASTPVAVGSLVSLFGTGIGPATSAAATSLPLPYTLSTYQVKIGGLLAPLLYASSGQINCQIPYELAGQTSAQVVVTNGTVSSSPATVALASSAPGIFVGAGTQGAVLNQDYSANSAANPAAIGSVVQIFATGQGVVSNQPADGAAASTSVLATTATNPVVAIGGLPAAVQFSGLAQGFVGLWQVNAVVPAGVTPGGAVTLTIAMNNQSNQVTIAVK
jgi:uncharacterized protein (TIGR03437 family)